MASFIFCQSVWAESPSYINKKDRILILAPHPDDEAIGAAGIIQKAMDLKVPTKVVYLTNGDNNELAFLVYEKKPILTRSGLMRMGELRRQEAVQAMNFLGLKDGQLIFLGYPDLGTSEIFVKYWDDGPPFKSMLTRVRYVPYKDAMSYGAAYKGESILSDLKRILLDFHPTKIFVTLPADTNGDHRAYYLFLQVALWDLEGKISQPDVYPFIVHVVGWPMPRGFHPELPLEIPEKVSNPHLTWIPVELSSEEIQRKKETIDFYKSQNAYNPEYLYSFARSNELFAEVQEIALPTVRDNTDWQEIISSENVISHMVDEKGVDKNIIKSTAYAVRGDKLLLRMVVNPFKSKLASMHLYLMGYKKGVSFSNMPKICIKINFDWIVSVYDKLRPIKIEGMNFSKVQDVLTIEFPLAALGNPQRILSSAKTMIAEWPIENTAWRTLVVNP